MNVISNLPSLVVLDLDDHGVIDGKFRPTASCDEKIRLASDIHM